MKSESILEAMPSAAALAVDPHVAALMAQVERIDLLLQQQLRIQQQYFAHAKHEMEGLLITGEEIDALIGQPIGMPLWALRDVKDADTAPPRPPLPGQTRLGQLVDRFGLSTLDTDILLLLLLPQFDQRYGKIFAYMQDDVGRKHGSADFCLNILSSDCFEKYANYGRFASDAPLIRHRLLRWPEGSGAAGQGASDVPLTVDPDIFRFLLGHGAVPADLAVLIEPLPCEAGVWADEAMLERLLRNWSCPAGAAPPPILSVSEPPGGDARHLIAAAAERHGKPAFVLHLDRLPAVIERTVSQLEMVFRYVRMVDGALLLDGLDAGWQGRVEVAGILARLIDASDLAIAWIGDGPFPDALGGNRAHLAIDLPGRTLEAQRVMFERLIGDVPPDLDLALLARRFRASTGEARLIVAEADFYRRQRGVDARLAFEDLHTAASVRRQRDFGKLAQRIRPVRGLADLVVSEATAKRLDEILIAIRQRDRVLDQGFRQKLGYGLGISALFYGVSGTGKTMMAEALAKELGVDLIRVDLSTVVNKYIGETEKHLSALFDLAGADSGLLFFDEADALFGKRSETKDAHDRYANIEISYLLQRLEDYPGLVVLATNNRSHLDDAFTRRITFAVAVEFPDAEQRMRMWRTIWPAALPVGSGVDLRGFAERADLTGASIRNIALMAAWFAAEEGGAIAECHIDRAMKRELRKLGQVY